MTSKIIDRIEDSVARRLEYGKPCPAVVLLCPMDYRDLMRQLSAWQRDDQKFGFQVLNIMTSFGQVTVQTKEGIDTGDLIFADSFHGKDLQAAWDEYYYTKVDKQLNDIVIDIIEAV
jgi:hypothetical protein